MSCLILNTPGAYTKLRLRLRILNVYLVDNGTERQLCVLEGGDQCAVHGFSSCA